MVRVELDPYGMAALGTVLATATVTNDRRQTVKRVQAEYEKYLSGNQVSGGTLELDRADWEWVQFQADACNQWEGRLILVDADQKLKAAVKSALNGGAHEPGSS